MKRLVIIITGIVFALGCSSVRESDILISGKAIHDNPIFAQPDSLTMNRIKSQIQSDPNHILAESITKIDGIFVLSLSPEEAADLGIDSETYEKFEGIVEQLNGKEK